MAALSRRGILAAGTGAAIPAAVAAAPSPDAYLVSLGDTLHALAAEARHNEARNVPHADVDEWCDRWNGAIAELGDLTPCTVAGLRAKAAATAVVLRHEFRVASDRTVEEQCEDHEWLALRLAEEMAARL